MSPNKAVVPAPAPAAGSVGRLQRRIAVLERQGPRLVQRAAEAGVDITYLGITPLFGEPQAHAGPTTDWIIGPAADLAGAIVPRAERDALTRLVRAGIDFPLVYVAHEVPKDRLGLPGA